MAPRKEKGSVLLESAIALPVLVLLTVAMVDLSSMMQEYFTLTRVTYEGARFGASSLLPATKIPIVSTLGPEYDQQTEVSPNRRMGEILLNLRENGKLKGEIGRRSFQLCKRSGAQDISRIVRVTLEYEYTPLFLSYFGSGIPVRLTADAPNLFAVDEAILEECA
jgi:hypothetical protein